MSKLIAFAAIQGGYKVVAQAEGQLNTALQTYDASTKVGFPNTAYFLPVVYRSFFCAPEEAMFTDQTAEAPLWCLVPLMLTAGLSIVLFFYPQPFLNLANIAVQAITGG